MLACNISDDLTIADIFSQTPAVDEVIKSCSFRDENMVMDSGSKAVCNQRFSIRTCAILHLLPRHGKG
jgi:hypothetical protein